MAELKSQGEGPDELESGGGAFHFAGHGPCMAAPLSELMTSSFPTEGNSPPGDPEGMHRAFLGSA